MNVQRYPFGAPVTARPPSTQEPKRVLILGAYPSALHVRWRPPGGLGRMVQALPVADEPTPFWDGADADERVRRWQDDVGFERRWGRSMRRPASTDPPGSRSTR